MIDISNQEPCPCGSGETFGKCCGPYLRGEAAAPSPEKLMRSRYTAFVTHNEPYIRETLAPESRIGYKEKDVRDWMEQSEWLGLEIMSVSGNTVEFTAKYRLNGKTLEHHEVSTFRRHQDKWYFVDGDSHVHEDGQGHHHAPKAPVVREEPKVGRNDPCPCGSGKKYKKCHGVDA